MEHQLLLCVRVDCPMSIVIFVISLQNEHSAAGHNTGVIRSGLFNIAPLVEAY
jgi:hypothetical protein